MVKPKLVTVTGHRTNTLRHQLNHYKDMVSDIFVVVYENSETNKKIEFEIADICADFGLSIHKVKSHKPFDWEMVTNLYNETKMLYPNDWWIVADDDEFQLYSKPISEIITDCDINGWKFVTGGFIDRIGIDGDFPSIDDDTNLWKEFPMAGFFRQPMSGACPNKVTLCKGDVRVSNGQHYAIIDGETTWKWRGWNHPLRYPVDKNFTQVHHFKWDSTVRRRLKAVADINTQYSYSDEYKKMYESLKENKFIVDISNKEYMFEECITPNYENYKNWNHLSKKIISL